MPTVTFTDSRAPRMNRFRVGAGSRGLTMERTGGNGQRHASGVTLARSQPCGCGPVRCGAVAQMEHTRRGGQDDVPTPTTGLLMCYYCRSIRSVIRGSGSTDRYRCRLHDGVGDCGGQTERAQRVDLFDSGHTAARAHGLATEVGRDARTQRACITREHDHVVVVTSHRTSSQSVRKVGTRGDVAVSYTHLT